MKAHHSTAHHSTAQATNLCVGIAEGKSEGDFTETATYYNSVPKVPLRRLAKIVFGASDVPTLILITYAIYWCEVCYLVAPTTPCTMWGQALVAGLLVGIGLNANAYRALYRPMSRVRKRRVEKRKGISTNNIVHGFISPISPNAPCSTRSLRISAFVNRVVLPNEWSDQERIFDYGMMIRFFIIPFGVSSLSGMTNHARDEFFLVFPKNHYHLFLFLLIPSLVVASLMSLRLYFIMSTPLTPFWRVVFFNGKLLL